MNDIENMINDEPSPDKKLKKSTYNHMDDDLNLDNYEGGSDDEWDNFENEIAGPPVPLQSTQQTR
jgi:hypothetical protein